MIPQEKKEAVTRGLRKAFGVTEFEDISKVTGGHTTSLVFRIIVRGSPYLLKIIRRTDDPSRHYTSMRLAAEAGLAPRVWYTNIEDKVCITDFVVVKPLSVSEALVRFPAMLRTLHALPPFSRAPYNTSCTFLINKTAGSDGFLKNFKATNLLSEADTEIFLARYAELAAVYPQDDEMVSSHNDVFKPDNLLYDGQRVWLVDWEAAFLNDRYADLAVLAYHVVTNDEEESVYLQEYFGAAPDPYQRARFHLMQQIAHLFYTLAFLRPSVSDKPVDWSSSAPELGDYHRRMWTKEIDLADKDVKVAYGRAHWERLLQNVRRERYQESLRIVSERHAAPPVEFQNSVSGD